MKSRRAIAIILMMLANIFMLAHAVMPHHHHEGMVMVSAEKTHCPASHHCSAESGCCNSDGENACHTGGENCDLSLLIKHEGRSVGDELSTFLLKSDFTDTCLCILCYACNRLVVELNEATLGKYKRYTRYTETYTSPYVGASFGFRAPPAASLL